MALSSPGLTLAIDALFGCIKPQLDLINKLGPTDFSKEAPGVDVKPGATLKVPLSTVSEALAFDFRPAQIPTYVHKGGILVAKSMRIVRTPADVPARGRELARRRPDGAARRARLKRRRPADMRRRFIAF